jgi:hypothetical protein
MIPVLVLVLILLVQNIKKGINIYKIETRLNSKESAFNTLQKLGNVIKIHICTTKDFGRFPLLYPRRRKPPKLDFNVALPLLLLPLLKGKELSSQRQIKREET